MSTLQDLPIPLPPWDAPGGKVLSLEEAAALLIPRPPSTRAGPSGQDPQRELARAIDAGDAGRIKNELNAYPERDRSDLKFALKRAIETGRTDTVQLVLEAGVPIDGESLGAAAQPGRGNVLRCLISYSGDEVLNNGRTIFTLAVEHEAVVPLVLSLGVDVNKEDGYSETPLSTAVKIGTRNVIEQLLDAGANVKRGAPLHASLLRRDGGADLELMKRLLELGAPVDKFIGEGSYVWEQTEFESITALHLACDGVNHNLDAVRLLLAHGANPALNKRRHGVEVPDSTARQCAENRGYTDIVSIIREYTSEDSNP